MKNLIIFSIILACCATNMSGQSDVPFRYYSHTSDIMPKGHFRYSLFKDAEYGLTEKVTINAHPLWLFLSPSISIRWELLKNKNYAVSLYHGIACPTPIMRLVSGKGTGGFISPEFDIPLIFSIRNGAISTYNLAPNHRLTGEFGFEFALFNGSLEPGSSIDLPIISPRNAIYYKNAGFNLALGMEGEIGGKFDYYGKAEAFLFPFNNKTYEVEYDNTSFYFAEITGLAFWNITQKFKLGVGGRLTYGDYPFGNQWHLLPMLDFVKYVGKN